MTGPKVSSDGTFRTRLELLDALPCTLMPELDSSHFARRIFWKRRLRRRGCQAHRDDAGASRW